LVSILALGPGAAAAAPVRAGADADRTKNEMTPEKIRKALDQTMSLEFAEQTLPQALALLHEQTKLHFVFDQMGIAQAGFAPEVAIVSVKLPHVKLRSGLRAMLTPYHLAYVIEGDTIVVTSAELATHRQLTQRVSIDLERVPLGAALRQLARDTATNLVLDPRLDKEAETPMTLRLDDVPLETAVRMLAEVASLKPVRVGNVLFVTTKIRAVELRGDPDLVPKKPATPAGYGVPFVAGGGGLMQAVPAVPPPLPAPPPPPAGKR
jgi:hypothetical protein